MIETLTDYPVLEVELRDPMSGRRFSVPSCAFQGLMGVEDYELAGMGLAIIGNFCRIMHAHPEYQRYVPFLLLKRAKSDDGFAMPWPGMPTDAAVSCDPDQLPFDTSIFIDGDQHMQRRIDRLALMRRIEIVWVPYLKSKLAELA